MSTPAIAPRQQDHEPIAFRPWTEKPPEAGEFHHDHSDKEIAGVTYLTTENAGFLSRPAAEKLRREWSPPELLPSAPFAGAKVLQVSFILNGRPVSCQVEARTTLLDLLRDRLHLSGMPKDCENNDFGASTVLVDGRRALSSLILAVSVEEKEVVTIEGLAPMGGGPLISAYRAQGAPHCDHCTSGLLMSAAGFLAEPWPLSPEGIREGMAGNRCQCGAYGGIVAALAELRSQAGTSGA